MDSIKPIPIHTIVTHINPHFDELVGIYLLTKFGQKHFPGIERSERVYIDAGSEQFNGLTADQALEQGCLLLGVGGGMFDEHPTEETERVHDECAATLVAKYLGLDNDPCMERTIKYVRGRDLYGGDAAGLFGLASCLDTATRQGIKSKVVENMATMLLGARYNEEREFHVVAGREYKNVSIASPQIPNRPGLVIAWTDSDAKRLHSYAFHKDNVGVFVIRRSNGQIQIFPNQKHRLDMDGVVAEVRLAEAEATGETINPNDLSKEGKVKGAKAWHYQAETGIVMNGSLTAQNGQPTRLDLQTVVKCVIKGLLQEDVRILATR